MSDDYHSVDDGPVDSGAPDDTVVALGAPLPGRTTHHLPRPGTFTAVVVREPEAADSPPAASSSPSAPLP